MIAITTSSSTSVKAHRLPGGGWIPGAQCERKDFSEFDLMFNRSLGMTRCSLAHRRLRKRLAGILAFDMYWSSTLKASLLTGEPAMAKNLA